MPAQGGDLRPPSILAVQDGPVGDFRQPAPLMLPGCSLQGPGPLHAPAYYVTDSRSWDSPCVLNGPPPVPVEPLWDRPPPFSGPHFLPCDMGTGAPPWGPCCESGTGPITDSQVRPGELSSQRPPRCLGQGPSPAGTPGCCDLSRPACLAPAPQRPLALFLERPAALCRSILISCSY